MRAGILMKPEKCTFDLIVVGVGPKVRNLWCNTLGAARAFSQWPTRVSGICSSGSQRISWLCDLFSTRTDAQLLRLYWRGRSETKPTPTRSGHQTGGPSICQ